MFKTIEDVRKDAAAQEWAGQHYRGQVENLRRQGKAEVKVLMPGRTNPFLAGGELLVLALSNGGKIID